MNDAQVLTNLLRLSPWNVDVGREVVAALAGMGRRAVPALAQALARPDGARVPRLAAAWLLGRLGGDAAASALCAATDDEDAEVAGTARAPLAGFQAAPCVERAAA